jgi:hypothetical protein
VRVLAAPLLIKQRGVSCLNCSATQFEYAVGGVHAAAAGSCRHHQRQVRVLAAPLVCYESLEVSAALMCCYPVWISSWLGTCSGCRQQWASSMAGESAAPCECYESLKVLAASNTLLLSLDKQLGRAGTCSGCRQQWALSTAGESARCFPMVADVTASSHATLPRAFCMARLMLVCCLCRPPCLLIAGQPLFVCWVLS